MQQVINQLEEHIKGLGRNNPSLLSRHSSQIDKSITTNAYHSSIANNQTTNVTNPSLTRSLCTSNSEISSKVKEHDENMNPTANISLSCADYFRCLLQNFYLVRRNANLPKHEKEMYQDLETKILFTLFGVLEKHVRVNYKDRI